MDYRLDRIRDHAVAHLFPRSDLDNFIKQVNANEYDSIVLSDDRIRIGTTLYRFTGETTALRMADLLEDYVEALNLKVPVSKP